MKINKVNHILSLIISLSLIIGLSSCRNIHYGNISSNIANEGEFAVAGNWIYYLNYMDSQSLYKIRTDGKMKTTLTKNTINNEKVFFDNISLVGIGFISGTI